MKKIIILIIVIVVVVVVLGTGIVIYFMRQNSADTRDYIQNSNLKEPLPESGGQSQNKIATDDFSITLPKGWSKTIDTMPGIVAMAANPNEKINDDAAQSINFKSYLTISSDVLSGKTLQEYMQLVKNELRSVASDAIFSNENALTINNKPARAFEMEMTQRGVNFKVLLVGIQESEDSVWFLSYNTVKSSWENYKESFSESVRSFIFKR
jgi:hypothetical protein